MDIHVYKQPAFSSRDAILCFPDCARPRCPRDHKTEDAIDYTTYAMVKTWLGGLLAGFLFFSRGRRI